MSDILNKLQSFLNRVNPLVQVSKSNEQFGKEKKSNGISNYEFQSKVNASQAKLVRNNIPSHHDQDHAQLINSENPKNKTNHNQSGKHNSRIQKNHETESQRASRLEARSNKDKGTQSRPDLEVQDKPQLISKNISTKNLKADSDNDNLSTQNSNEAKAKTALKNRLKQMDIDASDEQLNDPAFLKQMLTMVESSNNKPAANDQEVNKDLEIASAAKLTGNNANDIAPSQDNIQSASKNPNSQTTDSVQQISLNGLMEQNEPDTQIDSKDLANLIKDRLAEIKQASPEISSEIDVHTKIQGEQKNQGIDLKKNPSQDLQVGREIHSEIPAALPTGDLDKMRVLQASALQAANAKENKGEINLSAADHLSAKEEVADADADSNSTHSLSEKLDSILDSHSEHNSTDQNMNGGSSNQELGNQTASHFGSGDNSNASGIVNNANNANNVNAAHNINPFHQTLATHSADIRNPQEAIWTPHQPHIEKNILDQIAKKLNGSAHLNGEEISIQLDPENLGKVRVALGLKDGLMNAKIGVENEHVKKIVEENLQTLRDSLENQGIKIQGMEVNVEQRHSSLFNPDGSNSQMFFNRHGQNSNGENRNGNNSDLAPLELNPESETGRRLGFNTLEYIA